MKKFLSVLLVIAMLTAAMIPALTTNANTPSVVVAAADNTDFYEATSSMKVDFDLEENPGVCELYIYIWYDSTQMTVSEMKDADENDLTVKAATAEFDPEQCTVDYNKTTKSGDYKKALQEAGVTFGGDIKCTRLNILSDGSDVIALGNIATVKFSFAGTPAIGDTYNYGYVVIGTNAGGDEVTDPTVSHNAVLTCIDDPFVGSHENFTIGAIDKTVQKGTTKVDVEIKLDQNPGINALLFYVVYPDTIKLIDDPDNPKANIMNGSKNSSIYEDDEVTLGTPDKDPKESINSAAKKAMQACNIPVEGKLFSKFYCLPKVPTENKYGNGTVATLTFTVPDEIATYDIQLCYYEGDIFSTNGGIGEASVFTNLFPEQVKGQITVECNHPTTKTVTTPATCTLEGKEAVVCETCGKELSSNSIPTIAHTFTTVTTDSTCTKEGSVSVQCSVCGLVQSSAPIPTIAHTPETVTTPATCTKEGSVVVQCSVCGTEISSTPIAKLAHTEVTVTTPATCTKEGSVVVKCSVCGTEISSTPIAKLAHTETTVTTPATCTHAGSVVVKCSVCNTEISSTPIAQLAHTEVTVTTPATCTHAGSVVVKCSVCETEISNTPIAILAHTPSTVTTPATCTEKGSVVTTCTVCGTQISYTEIPAKGHQNVTTTVDATYEKDGSVTVECSVCHEKTVTVLPRLTVAATVKFQTADGKSVAEDIVKEGLFKGDTFEYDVPEIPGYNTAETKKSITLGETGNEIVYVYAAKTDLKYTICIYDANGNKISQDIVVDGQTMGTEITINAPEIPGYTATVKSVTYKIGASNNIIDFKYVANNNGGNAPKDPATTTATTTTTTNKTQTGDSLWIIAAIAAVAVIGSASVVVIRRRKEND